MSTRSTYHCDGPNDCNTWARALGPGWFTVIRDADESQALHFCSPGCLLLGMAARTEPTEVIE